MKKRNIVKSKELFNNIINIGNRVSNKYYVICYQKKDDENNNYGFAVGTKMGNAVRRNKIKRQIKAIVDNNIDLFPKYYDYIIISKKELLSLKYSNMEEELVKIIKEIK